MSSPVEAPGTGRSRPAAVLLGAESLLLAGFAGWITVASLPKSDAARVISEAVTLLVLAVGGVFLARGLLRGNGFAKTPSLLWHLIVLLSGMWIASAGQPLIGGLLAIAGLAGLYFTARVPAAEL